MNKLILTLITTMAASGVYAAAPSIDVANKVATAVKIEAPSVKPVIDGEMDDAWADAPEYEINSYIPNGTQFTQPSGPDDISGKWRALWDATNLYLYLEVTDDTLVFASLNDFEAYISTAYTRYYGKWANSGYDLNDAQILWDLGNSPVKALAGFHSVFSWEDFPGTETAVKATATGYTAEVSITWAALNQNTSLGVTWDPDTGMFLGGPSEYEERDFIGFEVMLQDDDDGDPRDTKVAWYGGPDDRHGDYAWADTQVWGTLVLGYKAPTNKTIFDERDDPDLRRTDDFIVLPAGDVLWSFCYIGFYPFVYNFGTEGWIYIFDDGTADESGYYIYDFTNDKFGYTGAAIYPWYYTFEGPETAIKWIKP